MAGDNCPLAVICIAVLILDCNYSVVNLLFLLFLINVTLCLT